MTAKHTRPLFKPTPFNDGSGWRVEVHWPDGTTQHVDNFPRDYDACDFISHRSLAWLLKHPAPG